MQQLELFPLTLSEAFDMQTERKLIEKRDSAIHNAHSDYEAETITQPSNPVVSWNICLSSYDYVREHLSKKHLKQLHWI